MKSFKNLKRLLPFNRKATFSTNSYYSNKKSNNGAKFAAILGVAGYLYFQEDLLSSVLTQVQLKYYTYRTLMRHNKEIYERNQYSERLCQTFNPESRIEFLNEKISKQLDCQNPFEGDFLSAFVDDKIQEIKENGAQIYFAQRGGGKTLDSLRIARDWKKAGEPVLFFDKSNYSEGLSSKNVEIFEKYGFKDIGLLKEVLQEMNVTSVAKPFDIVECINKLFMLGHPPPKVESSTVAANHDRHKKQLLIVIDDADDLFAKGSEDEAKKRFLIQLKELMKQDLVKLLFLCREWETKNWLQDEFDAGVWKGISKGSASLKSKPVITDYLTYVGQVTGLKPAEAEKFFFFFGVDYSTLRDLKKYLRWYSEKNNSPASNIDDFIELKVKEYADIFKEKEIDKPLIRICSQYDRNPTGFKNVLTSEDKVKLAPVIGPEGWTSFKYQAAAYLLCGMSWKNIQNKRLM